MIDPLLDALRKKYEGEIASAKANINVYVTNPVGIGEHTDIVGEVQTCIEKIHDLEGCIQVIDNIEKQVKQTHASLN